MGLMGIPDIRFTFLKYIFKSMKEAIEEHLFQILDPRCNLDTVWINSKI